MKLAPTDVIDGIPLPQSFGGTPSAVSAFEKQAGEQYSGVQKELDALKSMAENPTADAQGGQDQGFSSMASGFLQTITPPSMDDDDDGDAFATTMPAMSTMPQQPPVQSAPPNLTNGSVPLSSVDPGSVPMPSPDAKRPPGDTRTAQQIIDENPVLKNLGNQGAVPKLDAQGNPVLGKDGKPEMVGVRDALKQRCGDFDTDPDAAYRAVQVLNYLKTSTQADGKTPVDPSVVDDGKVDGFTGTASAANGNAGADARHGTVAGMLQDFGKQGYSYLKDCGHALPHTNDSHVTANGTNLSNIEWVGHQILKGLSEAFSWMAKIAEKVLGKIPGVGKLLAGLAGTITTAISGALNVADTALMQGNVHQAAVDMGARVAGAAVDIVDPTGLAGDAVTGAIEKKANA